MARDRRALVADMTDRHPDIQAATTWVETIPRTAQANVRPKEGRLLSLSPHPGTIGGMSPVVQHRRVLEAARMVLVDLFRRGCRVMRSCQAVERRDRQGILIMVG